MPDPVPLRSTSDDPSSQDLAHDRTDLAEDRTLLANERTYAAWTRTAFAALALALGFMALFGKVEPAGAARAVASAFVTLGVYIQWQARAKARATLRSLHSHAVRPNNERSYSVMLWAVTAGGAALVAAIWGLA